MTGLLAPFADPALRGTFAGAIIMALSAAPVGVFLMLRRMSLAGDSLSHGVLPGVAVGFLLAGFQTLPMTIGGILAGMAVALFAGLVSRFTVQREDTALAAFYLISLALGTLLLTLHGEDDELIHVLFGGEGPLGADALVIAAVVATITLLGLATIWRALLAECLDSGFLRSVTGAGTAAHLAFLAIVVLNLVGAFQALGTLLAIGLMMLPAATSRFWVRRLEPMCALAMGLGVAASYLGTAEAATLGVPAGPAITLTAGAFYIVSLLAGPYGMLRSRQQQRRHRLA